MFIKNAKYIGSYTKVDDCPHDLPEFSFIGRSNVGKSSLINMILNRRNLARTSNTPGKTQTINYYLVDEDWYLVDLPGYGYAKVSRTSRIKWEKMIRNYLLKSPHLMYVLQLVDSRIPPQEPDIEFINWMGKSSIPFVIVFTKLDKLKPLKISENIELFKERLLETWEELPMIFQVSSVTKVGKDELLEFIESTYKEYRDQV